MILHTYIVQYVHAHGSGWALMCCSSPGQIEGVLRSQSRCPTARVTSFREVEYIGNETSLVAEGNITTYAETPYDLAVLNGFTGTEQEWLESLKGETGDSATINGLSTLFIEAGDHINIVQDGNRLVIEALDIANYNNLDNHPSINDVELTGNKTSYDLGLASASDIPDVSQFITNSANNLINYYLKTETYTQSEVNSLIGAISQFHYEIATSTSAITDPQSNVLYLIGPTGTGLDQYEEYVYPNSTAGFVKIGDTSIDLSGYVTITALNTALQDYQTKIDSTHKLDYSLIANTPTIPTVPTNVSAFNNDAGYLTSHQNISGKADKVVNAVNENLAGLDSNGNLTDSGIAPSSLATQSDISGFITNTVNNLTNYYLKSETYTQAEVNALIGAIQQFHYEIYATLPQTGQSNVLYLIGPTGSGSDKYEEYVYSNSAFTKIGDTSIDLSGYVTTSALNTALADYATTQDLDDSKVFWAEVDVTTFAEMQDAIDAGRTVMLKDEDGYQYVLSYIDDTYISFSCSSGDEMFIKTYNVYDDDSWELLAVYNTESQDNKVSSISSTSNNTEYPSARAVYDALQSYTPTSNLATVATSGNYNDLTNKPTIPTVPVQDVTVGGTSVVSNGTAVIPAIPTVPTNVSSFTNDAGYLTQHQDISGKESISNKVTSLSSSSTDTQYPSAKCMYDNLDTKMDKPTGGTAGQVLKKTVSGVAWGDVSVNNFVGWFTSSNALETAYPSPSVGFYAYVEDASPATTVSVYCCATAGTWVDSGRDIDMANVASYIPTADTMPVNGFLPNVLYKLGTLTGEVTFLIDAPTDTNIVNMYSWTFDTDATAPTITWPAEITSWDGAAPTIRANKNYEISVMDGLGAWLESNKS